MKKLLLYLVSFALLFSVVGMNISAEENVISEGTTEQSSNVITVKKGEIYELELKDFVDDSFVLNVEEGATVNVVKPEKYFDILSGKINNKGTIKLENIDVLTMLGEVINDGLIEMNNSYFFVSHSGSLDEGRVVKFINNGTLKLSKSDFSIHGDTTVFENNGLIRLELESTFYDDAPLGTKYSKDSNVEVIDSNAYFKYPHTLDTIGNYKIQENDGHYSSVMITQEFEDGSIKNEIVTKDGKQIETNKKGTDGEEIREVLYPNGKRNVQVTKVDENGNNIYAEHFEYIDNDILVSRQRDDFTEDKRVSKYYNRYDKLYLTEIEYKKTGIIESFNSKDELLYKTKTYLVDGCEHFDTEYADGTSNKLINYPESDKTYYSKGFVYDVNGKLIEESVVYKDFSSITKNYVDNTIMETKDNYPQSTTNIKDFDGNHISNTVSVFDRSTYVSRSETTYADGSKEIIVYDQKNDIFEMTKFDSKGNVVYEKNETVKPNRDIIGTVNDNGVKGEYKYTLNEDNSYTYECVYEDGHKVNVSYDPNQELIVENEIDVIKGANSTYVQDSNNDVVISADADVKDFYGVYINGNELPSYNYTVTKGSIIITLKDEFLDRIEKGEYKIEIRSLSGSAFAKLNITGKTDKPQPTPKPDNQKPTINCAGQEDKNCDGVVTCFESKGPGWEWNEEKQACVFTGSYHVVNTATK